MPIYSLSKTNISKTIWFDRDESTQKASKEKAAADESDTSANLRKHL